MIREIKFRGKDEQGNWHVGMLYEYQNKTLISVNIVESPTLSNPGGLWIYHDYEVIPQTVSQFTGLKDINGVDVFGGDIMKGGIYKAFKVQWDYENMGFNIHSSMQHFMEVIGNIHDNKELLK